MASLRDQLRKGVPVAVIGRGAARAAEAFRGRLCPGARIIVGMPPEAGAARGAIYVVEHAPIDIADTAMRRSAIVVSCMRGRALVLGEGFEPFDIDLEGA